MPSFLIQTFRHREMSSWTFSSRHALLFGDTSFKDRFGWSGFECSSSSGCLQVHKASWWVPNPNASIWDPDCKNIESYFSLHASLWSPWRKTEKVIDVDPTWMTIFWKCHSRVARSELVLVEGIFVFILSNICKLSHQCQLLFLHKPVKFYIYFPLKKTNPVSFIECLKFTCKFLNCHL